MPIATIVKNARKKNHSYQPTNGTLLRALNKAYLKRIFIPLYSRLAPYCESNQKILDIGAGSCYLTSLFKQDNHQIDAIDIENLSIYSDIKPIIYDGYKLPFSDQNYDIGLLINVLHHTENPPKLLKEALRVCRRVIVHEDTPQNQLEWGIMQLADTIGNLEFRVQLHQTPNWWKHHLEEQKYTVHHFKTYTTFNNNFFMFGRYSLFVAEANKNFKEE